MNKSLNSTNKNNSTLNGSPSPQKVKIQFWKLQEKPNLFEKTYYNCF